MITDILRSTRQHLHGLADLILPRRCIVCEEKLAPDEKHLCRNCSSDIPQTRFWQLKHNRMSDKFNDSIQKWLEKQWDISGSTTSQHERYAYAAALFFFNDDANYKKIPYSIKYKGNIQGGRHFGILLGQKLASAQWFGDIDVIIPVPLHWRRRWTRGYNQAEIIASGLSAALETPVRTDILKRHKYTKTQIRLNIKEKAGNVDGAFSVTAGPHEGIRHILLVDDVFTTGSTLLACFVALRKAFPPAVRISIATLGFVGRY